MAIETKEITFESEIEYSLLDHGGYIKNQMEWVRQMNACKAQAEEIVKAELIYD